MKRKKTQRSHQTSPWEIKMLTASSVSEVNKKRKLRLSEGSALDGSPPTYLHGDLRVTRNISESKPGKKTIGRKKRKKSRFQAAHSKRVVTKQNRRVTRKSRKKRGERKAFQALAWGHTLWGHENFFRDQQKQSERVGEGFQGRRGSFGQLGVNDQKGSLL